MVIALLALIGLLLALYLWLWKIGVLGTLDVSSLINCREILSAADEPVDMAQEWPHILKALQKAF